MEDLERWDATLPGVLEKTLQESVRKLELAAESGRPVEEPKSPDGEYLPLRVTTEVGADPGVAKLKAETIAGRGLWLFSIRHLLTKTADVLHQHKWTILSPPEPIRWFTSDDPVIRLNYHGPDRYDFDGGWGSQGTEIVLPLSPRHLLYAQVGSLPPRRGTELPQAQAEMTRRFIAEHAHRMIFAAEPEPCVTTLRPRTVSLELLKQEAEQWRKWHEDQTSAERKLRGWDPR